MAPGIRQQNGLVWASVQVIALVFPLIVAARLALVVEGAMDEVVAADLVVATVGPWALALSLFLGAADDWFVPSSSSEDVAVRVRASSLRMLAVLTVSAVALGVVQPPNIAELSSTWVQLGSWLAVGAVPVWSTALLVRARGGGRVRSLLIATSFVVVLAGGATVLGRVLFLHRLAVLAPMAAAGVVASIGFYLAVTERVVAPLRTVVLAMGLLAASTGLALALVLASAPVRSSWVYDYVAIDRPGARLALLVQEPNTDTRHVQVSLSDGSIERLPRRIVRVVYAGVYRVEVWAGWRGLLLGTGSDHGWSLCRVDPAGERVCADASFEPGRQALGAHPRRPLVVAGDLDTLIVWDLASDDTRVIERPRSVRWPCITDDGDLIWRVETPLGPYAHEALRLGSAPSGHSGAPLDVSDVVETLELSHEERCATASETETAAWFVRGRRAIGRVAMMAGPGLPADGEPIHEKIGGVAWSGDGLTAALAVGRPRTVRFYREDLGLTKPRAAPDLTAPALSWNGRLLAYRLDGGHNPHQIVVRTVPEARVVLETTTESSFIDWDGQGRLLRVEDGRLRALDPTTGKDILLFPPEH